MSVFDFSSIFVCEYCSEPVTKFQLVLEVTDFDEPLGLCEPCSKDEFALEAFGRASIWRPWLLQ